MTFQATDTGAHGDTRNTDAPYWHDGRLVSMTVGASGAIDVQCELYPTDQAQARVPVTLSCLGVTSMTCSLDFLALLDHARAGNIINGRLETRPRRAVLKLFFADGYLDVRARTIIVGTSEKQ
ncbi:hypothetical protein [Massilia sp. CF038]|uniref:hypothetical protein n=1 Tax=Massilia sp. CF038 TaxID=1881045 RepID=UPI00091C6F21|nr:hypothetical protein [Massilia sp. CF038]SHG36501.1 hypothetical protein SAMN05428948_0096 [Massilia sp. CF038]